MVSAHTDVHRTQGSGPECGLCRVPLSLPGPGAGSSPTPHLSAARQGAQGHSLNISPEKLSDSGRKRQIQTRTQGSRLCGVAQAGPAQLCHSLAILPLATSPASTSPSAQGIIRVPNSCGCILSVKVAPIQLDNTENPQKSPGVL